MFDEDVDLADLLAYSLLGSAVAISLVWAFIGVAQ